MIYKIKRYWGRFEHIKDLRNYYLIWFLVIFWLNLNGSIFFLYPISLWLSFAEMAFVYFTVSRIVYLIALVPTWIIADRYSVKKCIVATIFLYSLAYLFRWTLPFIILPLISFIITESIMWLADSSMVWASEKYLYSFNKEVKDSKMFSLLHSVQFWIRAVATLVWWIIVFYLSMKWTQIFWWAIIFIWFILALLYLREPEIKEDKNRPSILKILKEWFNFSITHKKTLYFIIWTSLLWLGLLASRNVFQPLLSKLWLNTKDSSVIFSMIFTLQMVFSWLGSYISQKIDKRYRLNISISLILILMSLFMFSVTYSVSIILVTFLIWILAIWEWSYYTLSTIQINRFIENEDIRATVNSITSLVSALVLAIFIPIIWKLTDNYWINTNLYISSVLIFAWAVIIYIPHFREKI